MKNIGIRIIKPKSQSKKPTAIPDRGNIARGNRTVCTTLTFEVIDVTERFNEDANHLHDNNALNRSTGNCGPPRPKI